MRFEYLSRFAGNWRQRHPFPGRRPIPGDHRAAVQSLAARSLDQAITAGLQFGLACRPLHRLIFRSEGATRYVLNGFTFCNLLASRPASAFVYSSQA